MSIALSLHMLAAVVWVGGMFFAYMALRPAAAELEAAQRLALWTRTFGRFFPWVWAAVLLLPATGYWMIFSGFGGFGNVGVYVHLMQVIGIAMILIFLHVYSAPYQRLKRMLAASDLPGAAKQLNQIRILVATNLALGVITIVIASGGAYWS